LSVFVGSRARVARAGGVPENRAVAEPHRYLLVVHHYERDADSPTVTRDEIGVVREWESAGPVALGDPVEVDGVPYEVFREPEAAAEGGLPELHVVREGAFRPLV
jgi:hypothetical protein